MVGGPRPRRGFWLERPDIAACEIAALLGYELCVIDVEHGVFDARALDRTVAHCVAAGLPVLVRVGAADRFAIQQALDLGADGVVVPQIADLAEARAVAPLAKYPPLGSRGIGYSRTMRYGPVDDAFVAAENARTACWLMVETPGALADAAAIAALPAVDGLFVGPSDLSLTRGRGIYRLRAEDEADLRAVAAACAAAGKRFALPAPGARAHALAAALGADFVTVADDLTALRTGLAAALAALDGGPE